MPEVTVYRLERFCDELEDLIAQEGEESVLLTEAQGLLKKLLPNRQFVGEVLDKMVDDDVFLKGKIGTIDRNDIILHLSPRGSFSMRLFVWLPSLTYPIHDHGSWGIMGGYAQETAEVRYRRLDDGAIDGYARIEEVASGVIRTGDTGYVLPSVIHQMASNDDQVALTVHVYGRPVRKGFVQCFNKQQNSTSKLITPKLEKRLFAVRALGAIGGDIARSAIEKAFHDAHPLVRWESITAMEKVDRDGWQTLVSQALGDADEQVRNKARAVADRK